MGQTALKTTLKKRFPAGLWMAMSNLLRELRVTPLRYKGQRKAKTYWGQTQLKLNVGCGPNHKSGWVNIDLQDDADLALDMRDPIPLRDSSASMIYTEHFLEHLDYPGDTLRFLRECNRVLQQGGVISIGVPDTKWPLESYAGVIGDGKYFSFVKKHWHPEWCETRMEHINYHFRQDTEHRFAYDFETLSRALSLAGFANVRERDFDASLDTESRRVGTLYVEATKP
jgi:predicted SAM-dependent methyltransferase